MDGYFGMDYMKIARAYEYCYIIFWRNCDFWYLETAVSL